MTSAGARRARLRALALSTVAAVAAFAGAGCSRELPETPPERPPRLRPPPDTSAEAPTEPLIAPRPAVRVTDPEASPGDRDREPNGDRASAVRLTPGETAVGYLDPQPDEAVGDEDWYVVDVVGDAPALVRAELDGASDLDVVLEWMAPAGASTRPQLRADVNEKRPGPEVLPALRVPPGRAFFRVREAWYKGKPRKGSDRPYSLRVLVSALEPGVESEPNEAVADAGLVPWGQAVKGALATAGDTDLWRVDLPEEAAGQRVAVTLSGVAGVATEVGLSWGEAGAPVATSRAPAGEPARLRSVTVPEGRPMLVVAVQARSGAAPTSPYTLEVALEPASAGLLEREPNDSGVLATRLELGDAATAQVHGYVDASDDVDHFRIVLAAPASLHATLSPPLEADLELLVLPAGGGDPVRMDAGKAGVPEMLRGVGLAAGEWDLVVRGRGKSFDAQRPYALEVSLGDVAAEESEPNDDRLDPGARPLSVRSEHKGWLFPAGDRDCWRLELRAEGDDRVPVTLSVKPPPDVPLELHLYDPDGVLVSTQKGIAGATEATFTYALGGGTYTVRVSASEAGRAEARAPYHLQWLD